MAISATFLADFNQFNAAVTGADSNLRTLEGNAAKIGTTVTTTGTTSTSAMSGMASTAATLAASLGVAFSIGAVVNFGRELLRTGDEIKRMADQTNLSTTEVQRFQFIAGQSGVTVEGLVGAVQNLQQRLGDDTTGAAGAFKKLGINAEAFKALSPYEQILTLSEALRGETDVNERASEGAALFGKTWKEISPAIVSNMREVGDQAPIMSKQTVEALDTAGDALTHFFQSFKAQAAETVREVIDVGKALEKFAFWAAGMPAPIGKFDIATAMLSEKQSLLTDTVEKTSEQLKAEESALKKTQKAADDAKDAMERLTKAQQDHINSIADRLFGADDVKKATDYADAVGRVENITRMSSGAQKELAGVLEQGISALLRMGLSADPLIARFAELEVEANKWNQETEAFKNVPPVMEKIKESTDDAAGAVASFRSVTEEAAQAVTLSWSQAMAAVRAGQGTMSGTIPGLSPNTPGAQTRYDDYNNPYTYVPGVNLPGRLTPTNTPTTSIFVDAREAFFDNPASVQRLADKVTTALGTRAQSTGRG